MINNNMIDLNKVTDLIQDATEAGYNVMIIINGEYYTINPDTIPATTSENNNNNNNNNDLPF